MKNFTHFRTALLMLFILSGSLAAFAQTILLDPAGAGGFESGTTFAANGWATANSSTLRAWYLGTAQAGYSGARGAHIGNSASTVGTSTGSRVVHLYRELVIPVGATNIELSFRYKQTAVSPFSDYLTVTMDSQVAFAGSYAPGTNIITVNPDQLNTYSTFTTVNTVIPDSFAGATTNLTFTFIANDATPHAYGALDDVRVSYTALPECTGVPDAGAAIADTGSVCGGESFNITLQGASAASALAYQWYSSADGITYAPISGAVDPYFNSTQTSSTYYRATVTCTPSGLSSDSVPVLVKYRENCYCTASATNTNPQYEKIAHVTLANLDNQSSSAAGYEDFKALSATITQGTSYPINIATSNSYEFDQVKVYIDYDQDGLFTGPGENVFTSPVGVNYNGNFTVPFDIPEGITRMRIRLHDTSEGANSSPCGLSNYGQVEDYSVNVMGPLYCTASAVNTNPLYEKINNVTLANLNNSSSSGAGYEDFTAMSATISKGTSYPIYITSTNGYEFDQVMVFIDYDQDGLFTGPGENVYTSPVGVNYNGNFTVPFDTPEGITRMRIRLHDSSDGANNGPCGTSAYGQVEDYSVNIVAPADCSLTTVWNGTDWNLFEPISSQKAAFEGDYTSTGDIDACEVTVNSGSVVISPGHDLRVTGAVHVTGGSLTFENNANLLQVNDLDNTGPVTIKRNASMRRLDYVYWGSPVASQDLKLFSPYTVSPTNAPEFPTPVGSSRFYTLNESTNAFEAIAEPLGVSFTEGKGYMLRAPNNFPADGSTAVFAGTFNGVPHNGNASVPVTVNGLGYNLLANPYPSPISADALLNAYPGTLYFWAHMDQTAGGGVNYATYNKTGATAATAAPSGTVTPSAVPNGIIQTGQGFLYRAGGAGPFAAEVIFTNAMRSGNNAGQFFRSTPGEKHRIWINLESATSKLNQMLIGYLEGATAGTDAAFDGMLNHNGSSISSALGGGSYAIQGRALPFTDTDIVPLNFRAASAGSFTLSVDHVDGLFLEGQDIFLHDNTTGITHNIKQSSYTFASGAGSFADRFSIIYQNTILDIKNPVGGSDSIIVYRQEDVLQIHSGAADMSGVKIFDISGRLIYKADGINANTVSLAGFESAQQVLLVQVTLNDNRSYTKKVVY